MSITNLTGTYVNGVYEVTADNPLATTATAETEALLLHGAGQINAHFHGGVFNATDCVITINDYQNYTNAQASAVLSGLNLDGTTIIQKASKRSDLWDIRSAVNTKIYEQNDTKRCIYYLSNNCVFRNVTLRGHNTLELQGNLTEFFNVTIENSTGGYNNFSSGDKYIVGWNPSGVSGREVRFAFGRRSVHINNGPGANENNFEFLLQFGAPGGVYDRAISVSWQFKDKFTNANIEGVLVIVDSDRSGSRAEIARYTTNSDGKLTGTWNSRLETAGADQERDALYLYTAYATNITANTTYDIAPITNWIEIRKFGYNRDPSYDGVAAIPFSQPQGSINPDFTADEFLTFFAEPDANLTETDAAVVSAWTSTDNDTKLYDRGRYEWAANDGYPYPLKTNGGVNFGSINVIIDGVIGAANQAYVYSTDLTIKTTLYSGSITTTGLVTVQNGGAVTSGTFNNLDLTELQDLDGVSVTSVLDLAVAGTYTFTDCAINEVTNSSGGAITIVSVNSSFGTNTGPNITIVGPVDTYTFNSDTADTLIRYFDSGSQTVVDSVTGTTLDYEFTDTDPVDAEFLKQGYVPLRIANVVPVDGAATDVVMDLDEAYNASHGLVIGADYTYDRLTKALSIAADQQALNVRSSLADAIRTNASYFNTKLLMVAIPGLTRVDLTEGMTIASMATWKGAGMERFDVADALNPVEKWFAIKSVGSIAGATVHYRQTSSGDSTAVALTNNVVDEAFQYWDDPDHDGTPVYDYSGYMVIKSFLAGSKQGRVDVPANTGETNLRSNLYTVPLANVDGGYSGVDVGITADLTLVAGRTVGGVAFAYEWIDGGVNSGADIADQINFNAANNPNAVIPGGTGLRYFELGNMVIHNATAVETERGFREVATPTLVGFYVSRGGADHPDFTRFQGDDGSYYTPAVQNQSTVSNLPTDGANILLEIYNITTDTVVYSGDPAGSTYSQSYIEGTDYTAGDEIRIRFAELNGSISFKSFSTVTTASSTGWSVNAANFLVADTVYGLNAVDGSSVTKFTYSPVDNQFNLAISSNFIAAELFAYYCFVLTTSAGINQVFGAYLALDVGNYVNITSIASIFLDNETTTSQYQTDTARIYRDDGVRPVLVPTTSGYGIDVNWQNVVYVQNVGGSALLPDERARLFAAALESTSQSIASDVADLPVDIDTQLSATHGAGLWTGSGGSGGDDAATIYAYFTDGVRADAFKATGFSTFDPAITSVTVGALENNVITASTIADNAFTNSAFTTGYYNTINSELDSALAEYDAPTKAEFDAGLVGLQSHGDLNWVTATGFSTLDISGVQTALSNYGASTFDPSSDVVANVSLVDVCTTNSDMRGTDGANTVSPDNATIASMSATAELIRKYHDNDSVFLSSDQVTKTTQSSAYYTVVYDDDGVTPIKTVMFTDSSGNPTTLPNATGYGKV